MRAGVCRPVMEALKWGSGASGGEAQLRNGSPVIYSFFFSPPLIVYKVVGLNHPKPLTDSFLIFKKIYCRFVYIQVIHVWIRFTNMFWAFVSYPRLVSFIPMGCCFSSFRLRLFGFFELATWTPLCLLRVWSFLYINTCGATISYNPWIYYRLIFLLGRHPAHREIILKVIALKIRRSFRVFVRNFASDSGLTNYAFRI